MNDGAGLRREAGVVAWNALTDEQKQAGRQAHRLLSEMARSDEKVDQPKPCFLPRLDRARWSRVLLIDGGRGSGKTALLLTLLDHWRRPFIGGAGDDALPVAGEKPTDEDTKLEAEAREPRGQIVPVGLLDLHPLAPSANLLMHVVGRFGRVVEWLEEGGDKEKEPPAWHLAGSGVVTSRKKWQALLRAVAAAWDGSADQRRGRLDLEAYAVELEEAERHRLDLTSTFTDFVEALVEDFAKRWPHLDKKRPPLFVLAVDDADMSPSRSVELLDMLRMLWHPRVAFVLTGDSELFLQTLAEHFLGEMRKPLRHHGIVSEEVTGLVDGRQYARLATEVYDKIIPPGHRCRVLEIPAGKRLDLAPVNLAAVFDKLPVDEVGERSLASYFREEPQLGEALPDRLRALMDLAGQAQAEIDAKTRQPYAPASRVVEVLWKNAIRSAGTDLRAYDDVVRVREPSGAIEVTFPQDPPSVYEPRPRLFAQSEQRWPRVSFFVAERLEASIKSGKLLPPRLTAALMLASDVLCDQEHGLRNTAETDITGYEGRFAVSEYQPPNSSTVLRFPWPLPPGHALPYHAAFLARWKRAIGPLAGTDPVSAEKVDEAAKHFLRIVLTLTRGTTGVDTPPDPPTWESLAAGVYRLMEVGSARARAWAMQRAGLLAAPEYGLSYDASNAWLKALRDATGRGRWKALCAALRKEREERLQKAEVSRPAQTLAEIDASFPGHSMYQEVMLEAGPDPFQALTDGLVDDMKSSIHELKEALGAAGLTVSADMSERLGHLGTTVLTELTESLHGRERLADGETRALKALWDCGVRLEGRPDLEDLIAPNGRKLTVAGDVHWRFRHTPLREHEDLALTSGVVRVFSLEPSEIVARGKPLPPLLALLYEYAWDFASRHLDGASAVSPLEGRWPGIEIVGAYSAESIPVQWPAFRWPMFSTARQIVAAWNERVCQVMGLSDGDLTPQDRIDALALWFMNISASGSMFDLTERELSLSLDLSAERCDRVVSRVYDAGLAKKGEPQWNAAGADWYENLILLAAPESGLSVKVARAIVNGCREKKPRPEYEDPRAKRLVAGGAGARANIILTDIEQRATEADHPWLTLPERPSSAG